MIALDEFNGSLSPQAINKICDGEFQYEQKYKTASKISKCPVIVVSNDTPLVVYAKYIAKNGGMEVFNAMCSRFHFIELREGDDIKLFSDLWEKDMVDELELPDLQSITANKALRSMTNMFRVIQ